MHPAQYGFSRVIATSDYIPRSGRRNPHWVGLEKGVPIRANENFSGRFAGTIGILSSQRILLPKGMPSLLVPIDFIRGDENRRAGVPHLAERLQDVGGSQGVDSRRFPRGEDRNPGPAAVLQGEAQNQGRLRTMDFRTFAGIAQIAEFVPKPILELQLREERSLRS